MGKLNKSKTDLIAKRKLCKGLELLRTHDGHWLCFKANNGLQAMIHIESILINTSIAKDAILWWADDMLSTRDTVREAGSKNQKIKKEGGWDD